MFDTNLSLHTPWLQAAVGAFFGLPYGSSPHVVLWLVFDGYLH